MTDSHGSGKSFIAPTFGAQERGADEDCQVCLRMTIPQHVDCQGSKLEDIAGAGDYEVLGG